ncbi:MAG: hypothetical protein Q8K67_09415 [Geothrix sp.]|nr:hypothetical protein [Geothrix sp.]
MIYVSLGLLLISISAGLIPTFVYFDKIIEAIYTKHRDRWKEMGSPVGILWRPIEILSVVNSTGSTLVYSLVWVFKKPNHFVDDDEVTDLLFKFRRHFWIWIVSFLAFSIAIVNSLQYFPVRQ